MDSNTILIIILIIIVLFMLYSIWNSMRCNKVLSHFDQNITNPMNDINNINDFISDLKKSIPVMDNQIEYFKESIPNINPNSEEYNELKSNISNIINSYDQRITSLNEKIRTFITNANVNQKNELGNLITTLNKRISDLNQLLSQFTNTTVRQAIYPFLSKINQLSIFEAHDNENFCLDQNCYANAYSDDLINNDPPNIIPGWGGW
jgi:prefoldin subunit 5